MRFVIALCVSALPATAFEIPGPVTDSDYRATDPEVVAFGRMLFWDPVLSGNDNISCGTCHHPRYGTSDGVSLGLGEGAVGVGPQRAIGTANVPMQRTRRNTPGLWNLGAAEFQRLFHDGRVERVDGAVMTPFDAALSQGFDSVLAAQVLVPLLDPHEMAGHPGENPVADAVDAGRYDDALDLIAAEVAARPGYRALWDVAFPEAETLAMSHLATALAQFVAAEWRSDTAPFDGWLRGEGALHPRALEGLELFYGAARCGTCHSGPFQTDHRFHAMGQPQIGAPDLGRYEVTGADPDRYAFRTPSLRNVTDTGPWGHAGAYTNLRDFVRDHAAPRGSLASYQRDAALPVLDTQDWTAMDDPEEVIRLRAAVRGADRALNDAEITSLMAFLETLRDETAFARQGEIPAQVPSGLAVDG